MPTQDERFATLESFRTETIKAYGEMAMELAMVKGLTSDAIGRLAVVQRDVSAFRAETQSHFDEVHDRLNQMYDEINAHTLLLHQILDRLPPAKE